MALHDDGTMDVLVGGVTERRPYTVNFPGGGVLPQYDPEVRDGEQLVRSIGSLVPTIVQAQAPFKGGYNPVGPLEQELRRYASEHGLEVDEQSLAEARAYAGRRAGP